MDGRFESDACSLLRKPDFLFRNTINKDAEVMLDDSYKWLRRLGECHFFLPNKDDIFSVIHSVDVRSLTDGVRFDRGPI